MIYNERNKEKENDMILTLRNDFYDDYADYLEFIFWDILNNFDNIKKENEKIRKMNMHEHKYGSDMEEKYLIEKNKNDRAIEYIEERKTLNWYADGVFVEELLNILNDRSDE